MTAAAALPRSPAPGPAGAGPPPSRCPLCTEERELRDSHIIPEFLYKGAYDEKHRLLELTPGVGRRRFAQKGLRERLLCEACEQLLCSRYERPVSLFWPSVLPKVIAGSELVLAGLDYPVLRLLLLSILWRAGVARGVGWEKVSLGGHAAVIRRMLLDADPGDTVHYQIAAAAVVEPRTREPALGTVMTPVTFRFRARRIYIFMFGGCGWYFVVSNRPIPDDTGACLSPKGTMKLLVFPWTDFRPFHEGMTGFFRERARRAGR